MIYTFFAWIWLILILLGSTLVAYSFLSKMQAKKKQISLSKKQKSFSWFLSSLGIWAILIGSWMTIEYRVKNAAQEKIDTAEEAEELAEQKREDPFNNKDAGDDETPVEQEAEVEKKQTKRSRKKKD